MIRNGTLILPTPVSFLFKTKFIAQETGFVFIVLSQPGMKVMANDFFCVVFGWIIPVNVCLCVNKHVLYKLSRNFFALNPIFETFFFWVADTILIINS